MATYSVEATTHPSSLATWNIAHGYSTTVSLSGGVTLAAQNQLFGYADMLCRLYFPGDTTGTLPSITVDETVYHYDGSAYVYDHVNTNTRTGVYNSTYDVTAYPLSGNESMLTGTYDGTTNYTDATLFSTSTSTDDMAHIARDYFDLPTSPYMDVDAYSTGNTANTTILTALWDNIQNVPSGMYPASYQVRISAYVAAGHMNEVAYVPYTAKQFQISFMNFIGYMTESEQDDAIINERVFMALELGHNDGERFVVDAPYKFRLGIDGDIQNETDPGTGGNVAVHVHIPPTANDNYNPDTSELTPQAPGQAMSVDNLLYTSYVLDDSALISFGQYIWANDLVQTLYANQTSPIENILSCKRIPFTIGGVDTSIKIGNIDTGIGATTLAGHVKKSASGHVKDCGTITVPVYNGGNWLDMTNKYSIYLPYCGIQSLPTDALLKQTIGTNGVPKVTGRTLGVKYYYDIIYGTVIAEVSVDGNAMFIFNGECGIDIPITASNRASNQLAMLKGGANTMLSGVSNVVGGVISGAMSGGLIGAAVGGLMGVGNTAMNVAKEEVNRQTYELHYTTAGGFNSQVASYLTPTITLYCEHVLYTEPKGYAKENGYPCYLNRNMSELTGYTELDGSIEISGIPCLEEERDMLKQALQDGFYL